MMVAHGRDGGLSPGKVPPDVLARILALPRQGCAELVVAPALGEDAAVLRLPAGLLAVTADPITFATPRPGHFAVNVNANDIAAMGARPRYFTLTVMVPPGSSEGKLLAMVADAVETARGMGIVLIGGHTEVTDAVTRPVLSVTMFGELVAPEPLRTGGARDGDVILQVGYMALEGTAILAGEHQERLERAVGEVAVRTACGWLDDPGISVLRPALRLAATAGVHALHDPTEGGLATGLREMALASGLGMRIEEAFLLRTPESDAICACLGVDPLGLISSGCLLAAVAAEAAVGVVADLRAGGSVVAVIGCFCGSPALLLVAGDGQRRELPVFSVDELARLL